jgi:hypothetical protein
VAWFKKSYSVKSNRRECTTSHSTSQWPGSLDIVLPDKSPGHNFFRLLLTRGNCVWRHTASPIILSVFNQTLIVYCRQTLPLFYVNLCQFQGYFGIKKITKNHVATVYNRVAKILKLLSCIREMILSSWISNSYGFVFVIHIYFYLSFTITSLSALYFMDEPIVYIVAKEPSIFYV